jgi:hypothetical protein
MAAASIASKGKGLHRHESVRGDKSYRTITDAASTIHLPDKRERLGENALEMLVLNGYGTVF